jgi:hypothetical protein
MQALINEEQCTGQSSESSVEDVYCAVKDVLTPLGYNCKRWEDSSNNFTISKDNIEGFHVTVLEDLCSFVLYKMSDPQLMFVETKASGEDLLSELIMQRVLGDSVVVEEYTKVVPLDVWFGKRAGVCPLEIYRRVEHKLHSLNLGYTVRSKNSPNRFEVEKSGVTAHFTLSDNSLGFKALCRGQWSSGETTQSACGIVEAVVLEALFLLEANFVSLCQKVSAHLSTPSAGCGCIDKVRLFEHYKIITSSSNVANKLVKAHEEVLKWGAGTGFERLILVDWET